MAGKDFIKIFTYHKKDKTNQVETIEIPYSDLNDMYADEKQLYYLSLGKRIAEVMQRKGSGIGCVIAYPGNVGEEPKDIIKHLLTVIGDKSSYCWGYIVNRNKKSIEGLRVIFAEEELITIENENTKKH